MTVHVFISYSHADDGIYVDRLAEHLANAGITVWFDRELISGERWEVVIRRQIETCVAFVVIMTPKAEASPWVGREINHAEKFHKPICPLLLVGEEFFRLNDVQYEDVRGGRMPSGDLVNRIRQYASTFAKQPLSDAAGSIDAPMVSLITPTDEDTTLTTEASRADIEARRLLRTRFMEWAFEQSGASERVLVDSEEFHQGQKYDEEMTQRLANAIKYLEGQGLIGAHWTMAGLPSIQLTHSGIVAMEKAIGSPEKPTEHFSAINILHVNTMVSSQIIQGSNRSSQTIAPGANELADAKKFLDAVRATLDETDIDAAFRPKLQSDLETIEAELAKPEPNWKFARAIGSSLRTLVETALGGVLTVAVQATIWP